MATYTTPRSIVTQVFQIGTEDSPGVGGSPTTRLTTLNSQLGPTASGAFAVFRPSGGKYVGQIVPSDLYSEGPINDTIDFNTLPFILNANVGSTDPGALDDGVYHYVFSPTPFALDTCKTYICSEGVTGAVYTYTNVVVPDVNFHLMRTGTVTLGGRMLGRKMLMGTTLPSPDTYQGRAISPLAAGLFSAASWDLLAATDDSNRLIPPGVDFVFRHNGVFAPWFALDDSVDSFEGLLDGAIDNGIQVTVPANVVGSDLEGIFNTANMNEGTSIYLKLLALGPLVGSANRYRFQIKHHAIISAPPRRGAQGNLRTWQFDCTLTPNSVTPFLPFEIEVDCVVPGSVFGY